MSALFWVLKIHQWLKQRPLSLTASVPVWRDRQEAKDKSEVCPGRKEMHMVDGSAGRVLGGPWGAERGLFPRMVADKNSEGEGDGHVGIWGGRFQTEDTAGGWADLCPACCGLTTQPERSGEARRTWGQRRGVSAFIPKHHTRGTGTMTSDLP